MTTGYLPVRYARLAFVLGSLALLIAGSAVYAAPTQATSAKAQRGFVMSGNRPVRDALVTLYATGGGSGPRVLGRARTRRDGSFRMASPRHARRDETRYIIAERGRLSSATGPNRAIRFATVLGRGKAPRSVTLNERTTVAAAFALAQFTDGRQFEGPSPGLPNAAATFRNLVALRTGKLSRVIKTAPNGGQTSTMRTFQSVANLLAGCVRSATKCDTLFSLARPPQGERPGNTLAAAHDIATNPAHNARRLFEQSLKSRVYTPSLRVGQRPAAWTLALRYDGNGRQMNGPGFTVFDRRGRAWIVNNYVFSRRPLDPEAIVCGGTILLNLKPNGQTVPGSPWQGGGIYGQGFGATIGRDGTIWGSNFAFEGSKCPTTDKEQAALSRSLTQFSSNGTALSPNAKNGDPGGWTGSQNALFRPQGMSTDRAGNVWVASCGNDNVVVFRNGNPQNDRVMTAAQLDKPFGIATDAKGRAWVSSNGSNEIYTFDKQGNIVHRLTGDRAKDAGIILPMGVATDSRGNVWVSNSGVLMAPCDTVPDDALFDSAEETMGGGFSGANASMAMLRPNGKPHGKGPFTGAGLILPWGVAIDGNDTVWVANFDGKRLSHLCGAAINKCPAGKRSVGAPISPRSGYGFDGLVRNTGVSIDPSGNVWLTNNWRQIPNKPNPGGHQMVVFIGLAEPVRTPLIGPVRTP